MMVIGRTKDIVARQWPLWVENGCRLRPPNMASCSPQGVTIPGRIPSLTPLRFSMMRRSGSGLVTCTSEGHNVKRNDSPTNACANILMGFTCFSYKINCIGTVIIMSYIIQSCWWTNRKEEWCPIASQAVDSLEWETVQGSPWVIRRFPCHRCRTGWKPPAVDDRSNASTS